MGKLTMGPSDKVVQAWAAMDVQSNVQTLTTIESQPTVVYVDRVVEVEKEVVREVIKFVDKEVEVIKEVVIMVDRPVKEFIDREVRVVETVIKEVEKEVEKEVVREVEKKVIEFVDREVTVLQKVLHLPKWAVGVMLAEAGVILAMLLIRS
jgi:hypothetical protein